MSNRNMSRQTYQAIGYAEFPPPPLPPVPSTPTISSNRPFTSTATGLSAATRKGTSAVGVPDQHSDVRYTVYLRLPFPRNGFVDPPPVDWDVSKEHSLWKVISRSRNSELDWNVLAEHFNVSAPFLLQQVAWLYERELAQVRETLRRVGTGSASTPLNAPGTPRPGATGQRPIAAAGIETSRPSSAVPGRPLGTPMSRTSSRNVAYPPASPISKDKPTTSTISATPMSRATSTSTARAPPSQASQYFPVTPTLTNLEFLQQKSTRVPKNDITNTIPSSTTELQRSPSSSSSSSKSSDDDSSVDHEGILQKRRTFRKFGTSSRLVRGSKDETDDEDSPAFLPWSDTAGDGASSTPPVEGHSVAQNPPTSRHRKPRPNVGGYEPNRRDNTSGGTIKRGPQPISIQPYSAVSDSGASTPGSQSSPRKRIPGDNRRGNESSPSMGSSFSDLSDASVTQSALEDQFLSAVGSGGSIVSRMSSISQAFRGRQQHQ